MIFLASTSKRKLIFRSLIIAFCAVGLIACAVLAYHLTDPASGRAPVSDEVASEYYHYYYTAVSGKKIALTFDDGPNIQNTLRIASILKQENVPATFFFIGEHVLAHPDVARDVANMGFEIGDHSFTHSYGVHSSYGRLARELNATSYVIKRTTGEEVRWYRPPFLLGIGIDPMFNPYITDDPSIAWTLHLGYLPVGADLDSLDWQLNDPEEILAQVESQIGKNGHIALFHDESATAESLARIIEKFKSAGYEFVTLDQLLIPPSVVSLQKDLRAGDTDEKTAGSVSQLQWFLYRHGDLDAYAITGIFGPETVEAVRRFQLDANVVDTTDIDPKMYGVVDAKTRAAIASIPIGLSDTSTSASSLYESVFAEAESMIIWVFSGMRAVIVVALLITFGLVFMRLWFVLCLLVYRRFAPTTHAVYMQKQKPGVTTPFLSVVVPAWNEAENIEATIRSLIMDKSARKEIIVVDDGSTDKTPEILQGVKVTYAAEDIRIIRVENGGKARALNIGIEAAKSSFVMTMDADAIIREGTLAAMGRHFIDPSVGAVAGKVYTTSLDSLFDKMQALEYMIGQNIDKPAFEVINSIGVVPGPIGAWRKETVIAIGGFSTETLVEDQDMTLSVVAMGKRVVYEPDAVAYTETPRTLHSFLKQRFRWIYGTMQCFWKYKYTLLELPKTGAGLWGVLPNVAIFSIYLPLMYPFMDFILIWSFLTGQFSLILIPTLIFTTLDILYAAWGVKGESGSKRLIPMVLFVRFIYRYLILYTVLRSVVRALEGRGLGWNKVVKIGEAQRLYFSSLVTANAAVGSGSSGEISTPTAS